MSTAQDFLHWTNYKVTRRIAAVRGLQHIYLALTRTSYPSLTYASLCLQLFFPPSRRS